MLMLVDCSNCHTPLGLPSGTTCFRCAVCQAITSTATATPYPSSSSSSSSSSYSNHHNINYYIYIYNYYNYYYYNPVCPPPLPSAHGQKKAVTVGITYPNTADPLKGCINDANYMKDMLIRRFNFPESSIIMLTDEEATDPDKSPTKHNIMKALSWLVDGCEPGDSLVFHYSGHGGQQKQNCIGEEIDGFDETLCPIDHEANGMIVDNEINETIVRALPAGVKLHAIIDACHSGTVLDLPFLCKMDRGGGYAWEDHRPPSGTWKGTSGGEAISFSGCDDQQTSMETALSKGTPCGTMTYAFIQAIEKGQVTTYGSIIHAMMSTIQKTIDDIAEGNPCAGRRQEPQLSSSHLFEVYTKPFSL